MKIRLSRELYLRATQCANYVGEPLSRWLWLCTLPKNIAKAETLPCPELFHPGNDHTVATMQTPDDTNHATVRLQIGRMVTYCEAQGSSRNTLWPEVPHPRPGRDYLLASDPS